MDALTLSVEYTLDDWREYQTAGRRKQIISSGARPYVTSIPIAAAIVLSALLAPRAVADTSLWRIFAIAIVWVSAVFVLRRLYLIAYKPSKNSMFLGPCTLEFDQLGIRTSRPGITATYDWNRFQSIDRQGDSLYLWLDTISALIVPLRALPGDLTADAAESAIRSLHADGAPKTAIRQASLRSPAPVHSKPSLFERLNSLPCAILSRRTRRGD